MKTSNRSSFLLILVLATLSEIVIAGRLFMGLLPDSHPAISNSEGEAVSLMRRLAEGGGRVQSLAASLETITQSKRKTVSKRHEVELAVIGAKVDKMERDLDRLNELRRELSPWHQYVIDHIGAAIVGLVDNVDVAAHLRAETSNSADYAEAISSICDWATYLSETASVYQAPSREEDQRDREGLANKTTGEWIWVDVT